MGNHRPSATIQAIAVTLLSWGTLAMPSSNRLEWMVLQTGSLEHRENLYTVVDAAERYADVEAFEDPVLGRIYPANVASIQSFLPQSGLLKNPYHLAHTEPVDGAAASAGQVGYTVRVISSENRGFAASLFGYETEAGGVYRLYGELDQDP